MLPQNDPNAQPAAETIKRLFAQLDKDERIALISNLLVNESVPPAQDTPAQPETADEPEYQPIMDRFDGSYEPEERDENWRRAWGVCGMLIAYRLLPMPRDIADTDNVPGTREERTTLDLTLSVIADSLHWMTV